MKLNTLLIASLASLGLFGCGDDVNKTTVDAKPQTDANTTPDAFVQPAAPTLGAQLERMGRPAINTVLNHTFDPDSARKQAAKDAYNAAANPATWATTALGTGDVILTQFEANLGIIDSLDSSATVDGCSAGHHPPFYDTTKTDATAYQGLAGALASDALLLNTATGTCVGATPRQGYLAVEGALATQHRAGLVRGPRADLRRDGHELHRAGRRHRSGARPGHVGLRRRRHQGRRRGEQHRLPVPRRAVSRDP